MIHIGKAPENEIVIKDSGLADHQASIVRRNDRYAIYAPNETQVELDGSAIPSKRWVWLPMSVMIHLGGRTTCQFESQENGDVDSPQSVDQVIDAALPQPPSPESVHGSMNSPVAAMSSVADSAKPSAKKRSTKSKRSGKKSAKKQREVARFITDNAGDAMVQLGEDGQLPELTLDEGLERGVKEPPGKQSNPLLLYSALAFSFVASLSMLFVDLEPSTNAKTEQLRARRSIAAFYGNDENKLKPYQILLREARLAYSRSDRTAEHGALRQVLSLLNSEDINRFTGLTGKRERDDQLRHWIAMLLGDT